MLQLVHHLILFARVSCVVHLGFLFGQVYCVLKLLKSATVKFTISFMLPYVVMVIAYGFMQYVV